LLNCFIQYYVYILDFSSVGGSLIPPIVEKQAYILPGFLQAMKPTITEKGITSKHIILLSFLLLNIGFSIYSLALAYTVINNNNYIFSGYYYWSFIRSSVGIFRPS
jgi:hypothetical protein